MSIPTFKLSWPPTVNTYWRHHVRTSGKMAVLMSKKGRIYKDTATAEIMEQNVPVGSRDCRYQISIDAYPPDRRRRDLDNILKPIFDALEDSGVLPNDEQIDILTVRRRGKDPEKLGHVIIRLSEIDPEDSLAR